MVVQEDEIPLELSVTKEPLLQESYNNHVKEFPKTNENRSSLAPKQLPQQGESESKYNKLMSGNRIKYGAHISSESEENVHNKITQINESDLHELRTVYTKCKEVMRKIETKYGHLLNLGTETSKKYNRKRKSLSGDTSTDEECHCILNKKIVFDDNGEQLSTDMLADKHICLKKLKRTPSMPQIASRNIEIEHNEDELTLPDDLKELHDILKDTDIEITYRNKVVEKIKYIRQEYTNEIKFNKHSLIEKLKSNPDELLDFKGSNLSTLPGYL